MQYRNPLNLSVKLHHYNLTSFMYNTIMFKLNFETERRKVAEKLVLINIIRVRNKLFGTALINAGFVVFPSQTPISEQWNLLKFSRRLIHKFYLILFSVDLNVNKALRKSDNHPYSKFVDKLNIYKITVLAKCSIMQQSSHMPYTILHCSIGHVWWLMQSWAFYRAQPTL